MTFNVTEIEDARERDGAKERRDDRSFAGMLEFSYHLRSLYALDQRRFWSYPIDISQEEDIHNSDY